MDSTNPPDETQLKPAGWLDLVLYLAGGLGIFFLLSLGISYLRLGYTPLTTLLVTITNFICLAGSTYLLGVRRGLFTWAEIGLWPIRWRWQWLLLAAGIVLLFLPCRILVGAAVQRLVEGNWDSMLARSQLLAPQGNVWLSFSVSLIGVGILAPISEELYFRGAIYNWFRGRLGIGWAILGSSVIFGLAHADSIGVVAASFILGVVNALVFEKTRSIWLTIAIHIVNNSFAIVLLFLLPLLGLGIPPHKLFCNQLSLNPYISLRRTIVYKGEHDGQSTWMFIGTTQAVVTRLAVQMASRLLRFRQRDILHGLWLRIHIANHFRDPSLFDPQRNRLDKAVVSCSCAICIKQPEIKSTTTKHGTGITPVPCLVFGSKGIIYPRTNRKGNPKMIDIKLSDGTGILQRFESIASHYIEPRNVDVWCPPGYGKKPLTRYPVLFMHDGQNLFDPSLSYGGIDWGIDEAITHLMQDHQIPGAIVVGIWNSVKRWCDYMPQKPLESPDSSILARFIEQQGAPPNSDNYLRFLVEELKPLIDSTFMTLPDQPNTLIMGSSMGSLISLYAVDEYPHVFGGAGCISTHWPGGGEIVLEYLGSALPQAGSHRLYFDFGTQTLDWNYEPYQKRMDSLLQAAGYTRGKDWLTQKFEGAEHSETSWRERVQIPLKFLLG